MYTTVRVTEALERLKGVYLEMPGTQLSVAEASRLAGVEAGTCALLLEALRDARFLTKGRNGLFVHPAQDWYDA